MQKQNFDINVIFNLVIHKMPEIKKILIANRGEIARRIIRTARKMGIKTVALWTELDGEMIYKKEADEAVKFESNNIESTFLDINKLISIAKQKRCDAIHPGYGFLSESYEFAQKCIENDIIWIGPTPQAMQLLSDKIKATQFAATLGIPTIPQCIFNPEDNSIDDKVLIFPLLIKAAAGGGGRGMKRVNNREELYKQLQTAAYEAQKYFGNPALFITPYFQKVRHIEVQIIADQYGNVIHLFDRECSVQRRHQKIIEEAPCISIPDSLRNKIFEHAILLAQKAKYSNAGTVEFIVLPNNDYFFLEVNTRIQVEHTVTEAITGMDIVECQIRIAQGEKLWISQKEISFNGHALECRLCAEDSTNNFTPSTGKIEFLSIPSSFDKLRIDADWQEGMEVGIEYDSLLAKIIIHAPSRIDCITKMSKMLEEITLFGVSSNISFLNAILQHEEFIKNNVYTEFIENHLSALNELVQKKFAIETNKLVILIATSFIYKEHHFAFTSHYPLFQNLGRWRIFTSINILVNEKKKKILYKYFTTTKYAIIEFEERKFIVNFQGSNSNAYKIYIQENEANYKESIDIQYFIDSESRVWIKANAQYGKGVIEHRFLNESKVKVNLYTSKVNLNHDHNIVETPIPGKIFKILVEVGQSVKKGDTLAIIDSMKTENKLIAHKDGRVSEILVKEKEVVKANQILFVIKI